MDALKNYSDSSGSDDVDNYKQGSSDKNKPDSSKFTSSEINKSPDINNDRQTQMGKFEDKIQQKKDDESEADQCEHRRSLPRQQPDKADRERSHHPAEKEKIPDQHSDNSCTIPQSYRSQSPSERSRKDRSPDRHSYSSSTQKRSSDYSHKRHRHYGSSRRRSHSRSPDRRRSPSHRHSHSHRRNSRTSRSPPQHRRTSPVHHHSQRRRHSPHSKNKEFNTDTSQRTSQAYNRDKSASIREITAQPTASTGTQQPPMQTEVISQPLPVSSSSYVATPNNPGVPTSGTSGSSAGLLPCPEVLDLSSEQRMAMAMAAAQSIAPKLPAYINPSAMNPMKFQTLQQKRKLLWSKKKEQTQSMNQWEKVSFGEGDDQAQTKFRRLMGINSSKLANNSSEDQPKEVKKTLDILEQQYEASRYLTHIARGAGLGYGSAALTTELPSKKDNENLEEKL